MGALEDIGVLKLLKINENIFLLLEQEIKKHT